MAAWHERLGGGEEIPPYRSERVCPCISYKQGRGGKRDKRWDLGKRRNSWVSQKPWAGWRWKEKKTLLGLGLDCSGIAGNLSSFSPKNIFSFFFFNINVLFFFLSFCTWDEHGCIAAAFKAASPAPQEHPWVGTPEFVHNVPPPSTRSRGARGCSGRNFPLNHPQLFSLYFLSLFS